MIEEDKLEYIVIYYKKGNKLITDIVPLTNSANKFKNLLTRLVGEDNKVFLPSIILSLPHSAEQVNVHNDNKLGKSLKYKLDLWLSDIDINILQDIVEKYGN